MVCASAIVTRDVTSVVNSLNAEGGSIGTLTTQTSAFTSSGCSALGGLLTQNIQVEIWLQQAATDIANSGSFSALECDRIRTAIANLILAHSAGLRLTTTKVYLPLQLADIWERGLIGYKNRILLGVVWRRLGLGITWAI